MYSCGHIVSKTKIFFSSKDTQRAIKGLPEAALKSINQKFHNRKIIAPSTLWANKMTFGVRAFKSLFLDTFEHHEKDDEAGTFDLKYKVKHEGNQRVARGSSKELKTKIP